MFQWGSAINRLGGTDTWPLLVVDWLVLSVGTIVSYWGVCSGLESLISEFRICVKCCLSIAALPLELIQYNYDLGDYDCSTITPLSLLSDIHTCCSGSNESSVAICHMMCIKISYCWLSSLFLSHTQHCILIWRVATNFLIWEKLCEVIYSSEVLKIKIHYEVV